MLIKYIGSHGGVNKRYEVSYGRKPYIFSNENDFTVDIKDMDVVRHIFSLPNNREFTVVETILIKEVYPEKENKGFKGKVGK